jgi:ribonuclease HII
MVGIDEVGRGCWAGPLLVVAARAVGDLPKKLNDSKLLSKKQRETLFYDIEISCELGEGWVEPVEIDKLGLSRAMFLGVERALFSLNSNAQDELIMDGSVNYCPKVYKNVKCVIKADSLYPVVSAASIYAKVKRDAFMNEIAKQYPDYQFEKHVGYGTKLHSQLLKQFGVSPIHRVSYKPIKALL